jgi:O-antigen/teichoic acid export membrane protein
MDSSTSLVSRIIKNVGFSSLAVLTSKLVQLALFILIARWLGASGLGQYSYVLSVVFLVGILSDLGITQYVVSQVTGSPEKTGWYLSHTFSLRLALSLAGLCIIIILAGFLTLSPAAKALLYLVGLGNFLINSTLGWRWIFQAQQKLKYEAFLLLVSGIAYSGFGLAFLAWQKNVVLIGVSYLISGIIFFWLCFYLVKTRFGFSGLAINLSAWRQILSGAFPMTLTLISISILYNADTILVNYFQGESATGLYNASSRIIQQTRLIPALLGPAFLPALSLLAGFDPARFRVLLQKGLFYLFTLFLPVAILVSFAAGKIIFLLFGSGFSASIGVLQVHIWGSLFVILYAFVFTSLVAQKIYKAQAILAGIGAVSNVILNLVLIPRLSIMGAAWAFFASSGLVMAGSILVLQKEIGFGPVSFFRLIAAPVGAGAAMAACWLVLPGWNWMVLGLFSLAIFGVNFLLLGGMPNKDWQVWKTLLLRKKEQVVGGLG